MPWAERIPSRLRSRLLLLAARIAEYTGWMSQEAGDDQDALSWTRHASELARSAAGTSEIASYAFVREAGLALYRQDPISTIDLAQQAQRARPGQLAHHSRLAARREAQGHALAGDRHAYERRDGPRGRAARFSPLSDDSGYPVLGSTAPDPIALARGWALCDLGRPGEAAAMSGRGAGPTASRVPPHQGHGSVSAASLAHALAGEIDQSCLTLAETLDDAAHVDSATVRTDLRELARTLGRWREPRTVREIHPDRCSRVLHRRLTSPAGRESQARSAARPSRPRRPPAGRARRTVPRPPRPVR